MLSAQFGSNVQYYRKFHSLSQAELAERAGIATEQLEKIECGRASVSLDFVEHLCTLLDISPASLFISPDACEYSGGPDRTSGTDLESERAPGHPGKRYCIVDTRTGKTQWSHAPEDAGDLREQQDSRDLAIESFASIVANADDAISYISPAYTCLYANRNAADCWGVSPSAMQGAHLTEIIGCALFEDSFRPLIDRALSGESQSLQRWLRHARSSESLFDISFAPHYEDENILGVIVIARDITELKLMQEDLEKQKTALDNAEKLAGVCSWQFDPVHRNFEVSRNWLAMHGYSNSRPKYDELLRIAHPDDRPRIVHAFEGIQKYSTPYDIEHRIIRQDTGEVRWVRAYAQIATNARGHRVICGAAINITEFRDKEARLARIQNAMQAANVSILWANEQGRFFDANLAACRILGYSRGELLQMGPEDISGIFSRSDWKAHWQYMQSARTLSQETEHKTKSGTRIPVEVHKSLQEHDGQQFLLTFAIDISERKYSENALAESELRLREAQQVASIGSFSQNADTGTCYWSEQTYRILGYDPFSVEPSFDRLRSHIHPDDSEKMSASPGNTANGHMDSVMRIIRADGRDIWARIRISEYIPNSPESRNAPVRTLGTIQDVSDSQEYRNRLEWELGVNEAIIGLKEMILSREFSVETVSNYILSKTLELTNSQHGFVATVDADSGDIIGHTLTNTLGSPCAVDDPESINVFHAADNGMFDHLFGHSVNTGKAFFTQDAPNHHAAKGVLPEGHVPITSFMSAPGISQGQVLSLIAVANADAYSQAGCDALSRFAHMFALALDKHRMYKSLTTLERAVENSSSSVVITNKDGDIEYVNTAFCSITGYSPAEVLGENPRILKSEAHNDAYYLELWETILNGDTWSGEMCNRKKNGDLFWESVAISPVFDTSNAITHFLGIKDDITHRKELERLKQDVEHIMRHDLKTPLNGILSIPQILLMEDDLSDDQRELIETIEQAGHRMLRMIDSSLDFFKMEMGTYVFLPRPVDLVAVVRRICTEHTSALSARNVCIHLQQGDEPEHAHITILGNEDLVHTMLANLVLNAIEASPNGETVNIDIRENTGVTLTISNRGAVPIELRPVFFAKYKTQGKSGGTGLGTYSAKLIADTLGYKIDMAVDDRTDSTTISIHFPGVVPEENS